MTKDKMIKKIMQRMSKRADDGIKKYGSTMLHSRKSFVAWIDDAQEELWDAIVYLEKLKSLQNELEEEVKHEFRID